MSKPMDPRMKEEMDAAIAAWYDPKARDYLMTMLLAWNQSRYGFERREDTAPNFFEAWSHWRRENNLDLYPWPA